MARGNGEGTISSRKRPDGRWEAKMTHGRLPNGKPRRITVYGRTRKEVADKLAVLLVQQQSKTLVLPDRLTFRVYLQQWLERKKGTVKETTYVGYKNIVDKHLLPLIGDIKVQQLEPVSVDHLHAQLRAKGLAPRMVQLIHIVLSNALKQAQRYDIVSRNVAALVERPKAEAYEAQVWTGAQVTTFLNGIREHKWHAIFFLAVTTGMRRGEILGLHWSDIDLEVGQIKITRNLTMAGREMVVTTPKTKNSRRRIYISPEGVALLRHVHEQQQQMRVRRAKQWQDTGYVFTTQIGTPIKPVKVSQTFDQLGQTLGLPRIRLHDLRHTNASLSARQGMPLKVLSERLGHASPGFTAKVYQHLYDDEQRAAALTLTQLTGSEVAG